MNGFLITAILAMVFLVWFLERSKKKKERDIKLQQQLYWIRKMNKIEKI